MLRRLFTFRFVALVVGVVALALTAATCGSGKNSDSQADPDGPAPTEATSEVIEAPEITPESLGEADSTETFSIPAFDVQPSINQLAVMGATPGAELELTGTDISATGVVDAQGALLWRDIPEGDYTVRTVGTDPVEQSEPAAVIAPDDIPPAAFYGQQVLEEGFGYLTTRDGTMLSINVLLPAGEGPFPTVVEYSGYSPSRPDGDSRSFPQVFNALGYAYVGVNMRGSGCSGGSFEFFEPVQLTDGYDAIEAVAAQPWVAFNEVGMVGISYPGISQLFVASTQPPSLAAITPLSVLDDSVKSTLFPGGILNTGFALAWSDEREAASQPYGQGWEQDVVDAGDTQCALNQQLRLQNTDLGALIDENNHYVAELGDPVAPRLLVGDITVPVFLAGAWQDEQTGGHFPAMLDDFTSTPNLYATMTNGTHVDALANLAIFGRYVEFLELYVARRTPNLAVAAATAPLLAGAATGAEGVTLPMPDRFDGMSYDEALAAYESQHPIRVLFEQGAADGQDPGSPLPRFERSYPSWPVAGEPASWYLGSGGTLDRQAPPTNGAETGFSTYVSDPNNVAATSFPGDDADIWQTDAAYDWQPIPEGTGLAWLSEPLADTIVSIGSGSADLWVRSSTADTDLEVTISEVRPDGQEVYVQSGWLRASARAFDEAASTDTEIVRSYTEADSAPLPPGEFALARVEIFPFAHTFRAGSRLRITVDAPGGARARWAFAETIASGETNDVAHDAAHPSRVVLNLVDATDVPVDPPACNALRAQPCRPYTPLAGG